MEECENCLKETRKIIAELFKVINAGNSTTIDSQDLLRALHNVKQDDFIKKHKINNKMINHFLL